MDSHSHTPDRKQQFFTVPDKTDGSKYLCYTDECTGSCKLGVTDAEHVWTTLITEELRSQMLNHCSPNATGDCMTHLRSSCEGGSTSLAVEAEQATFHLGSSSKQMTLALPKLSSADGKLELRELLFRMADCLGQWPGTGGAQMHHGPGKRFYKQSEFEPRRQPISTSHFPGARKRLPGDSLINPGTKRKQPATGVAFDDDADD